MPELPEVETVLNGIKPHILGKKITGVEIYFPKLRWTIPRAILTSLKNQKIQQITRRGKYLLIKVKPGTLIIHLGMSGQVRILKDPSTREKHDHVDILFADKKCLRYTDPRRFGAILWTEDDPKEHPLISSIGPEPLNPEFDTSYIWELSRGKKAPVKTFIMNSKVVAGVGNIYATEALFQAKIHPQKTAGKLTREECKALVASIKSVLKKAIKQGGTTLKDYVRSDGTPGYFSVELQVYGRDKQPCKCCGTTLKLLRQVNRSTVYCPHCQS